MKNNLAQQAVVLDNSVHELLFGGHYKAFQALPNHEPNEKPGFMNSKYGPKNCSA